MAEDSETLGDLTKHFVIDYFGKTYIDKYSVEDWNYYKIFNHKTNNVCESYHHVLNGKFAKKPTIWKFLYALTIDEEKLKEDYENFI